MRMAKVKSSRCRRPVLIDIFVGGAGGVGAPVSGRITIEILAPASPPSGNSMAMSVRFTTAGESPMLSALMRMYMSESGVPIT